MANFHGHILTRVGENLIAKLNATKRPLDYSSVKVGDGKLSGRLANELENLINEKLSLPVARVTETFSGQWDISAILDNSQVTVEFSFREWGIFARDPDTSTEILVLYANAGEAVDVIPAFSGGNHTSAINKRLTCAVKLTMAEKVSAIINPTQYVLLTEYLSYTQSNDLALKAVKTTADAACRGDDPRLSDARSAKDVYSWAKAPEKPKYTPFEIGAADIDLSNVNLETLAARVELSGAGGGAISSIVYDLMLLVFKLEVDKLLNSDLLRHVAVDVFNASADLEIVFGNFTAGKIYI